MTKFGPFVDAVSSKLLAYVNLLSDLRSSEHIFVYVHWINYVWLNIFAVFLCLSGALSQLRTLLVGPCFGTGLHPRHLTLIPIVNSHLVTNLWQFLDMIPAALWRWWRFPDTVVCSKLLAWADFAHSLGWISYSLIQICRWPNNTIKRSLVPSEMYFYCWSAGRKKE